MALLPVEIISLVFGYVTNSQDQLALQKVCLHWHEPAKRAFYKKVFITEVHDQHNYNYDKPFTFIKFIKSITAPDPSLHRIPTAGQFVKQLYIDFDVVLETKFMPTVSDYQHLATACPNLEVFDFPVTMFWNYLISANVNQYWRKMKRVPAFRITPMMNAYQIDRFLHFKSSLTTLEIDYYYTSLQQEQFKQMIRSFTNLEVLKIRTSTQSFTRMIPILNDCCPNLTDFCMDTTTSLVNETKTDIIIPRLYQLQLNLRTMSPYIIHTLIKSFPDLRKLVLRIQQSSVGLGHLISFITSRLSQSSIHLFATSNDFTTSIAQFIRSARPIVNILYDSRSSFVTNVPDLSFEQYRQQKELFVRYQGSISPSVSNEELPHMLLLRDYGFSIEHLKLRSPSSLFTSEKAQSQETSCVQHILQTYCPNLFALHLSMCYFDIKTFPCGQQLELERLTLENSTITPNSLKHLSQACSSLKYLELHRCEFDYDIDMPNTNFKRLSLLSTQCKDTEVVLYEMKNDCTTRFFYSAETRSLTTTTDLSPLTQIFIKCFTMDQLRFNHIPLYK